VVRRRPLRREHHTNVKNGGAEWIEGRRKPVEVVCVDNAIISLVDEDNQETRDSIGQLGDRASMIAHGKRKNRHKGLVRVAKERMYVSV